MAQAFSPKHGVDDEQGTGQQEGSQKEPAKSMKEKKEAKKVKKEERKR